MSESPFLQIAESEWVAHNALAFAIRDKYPVSPGHTLVIPKRVVATWFDATREEQDAIMRLVDEVKAALDRELEPHGYNVGFNAGEAAGQTVMHLHVHVIPRFWGDLDDPRGGIRGAIPAKQKYEGMAPHRSEAAANQFAALPSFSGGEDQQFAPLLRRALALATHADIIAAFVQPGGIAEILGDLRDALARGARVRLITGDYLNATSPDALRGLLGIQSEYPEHLTSFFFVGGGSLSFHAKAYIFLHGEHGIAYVGSSNLTRTALTSGLEWNVRAISSVQRPEFLAVRRRFEHVLASPHVRPLSRELVDAYSARARVPDAQDDAAEGPEPRKPPPPPHDIQRAALAELRALRDDGARAGLVVLATGLGKTYLAALDCKQLGGKRALFIAHREEILVQARDSWARVFPDRVLGLLLSNQKEPDADILFASVQTLARKANLLQFERDHFDYIVVDEFHHAAASTYRKVLGHFEPKFLLGLTATPDRMDGASILELCHDNVAYRAGLLQGIQKALLVPFRYFGVKDSVDFSAIPWRGRWPVEALTEHVATASRAEQALREYQKHAPPGRRRTLAFCCSVAHADFTASFLRSAGIHAVAVHSESTSAPREESLRRLRAGELEVICAVDVFNEGLDVPDINVVLMLRPTESPVIFLQQLGRGLRRPERSEKEYLTIVDFIGNHRSFMMKPQALVALTGLDLPPSAALDKVREQGLELPPGCHVEIETEAVDMLQRLSRLSKDDMLLYEYVQLRDGHGRRPTAAEVLATGVHMKPVRDRYGTWFDFVQAQGDLTDDEARVLERYRAWFADLSTTKMTRSYKMVTLKAMLERDALRSAIELDALVQQAHRVMRDDILLRSELDQNAEAGDELEALSQVWREQPIPAWTGGQSTSRKWFAYKDRVFRFVGEVDDADAEVFDAMTAELVELRLAEHRNTLRRNLTGPLAPIQLRVSHAGGRPILRLDRERRPDTPEGDTLVMVDGEPYLLGFRKVAVNTASRESGGANELPALMRRWFGATAGQPGSRHIVALSRRNAHWELIPERDADELAAPTVIPFPRLPFYPDLKVACGAWKHQPEPVDTQRGLAVATKTQVDAKRHFVVRASGDSMDGGERPIADGDLVLCEWLSATRPEEVEGKACLLTGAEDATSSFAVLKIPVRVQGAWHLRSANPSYPDQPVDPGVTLQPVARFVEVVEEAAGPTLWGQYDRESAVALFGAKYDRSWQVGHRDVEVLGRGHSVLFVNLVKDAKVEVKRRYADRFLSRDEFQWESQASTTPEASRGRNIIEQQARGQTIHLFCRYSEKSGGETQPFVYCGTLRYVRHEGSEPIRVWFKLEHPLPEALWRVWGA